MSINYKSYEFRVYEHISQLGKLLRVKDGSSDLKKWQSEIDTLRQNFEARRFRVAVVGEFNRGKTTFVNALLGKSILPADYVPTTAAINRITYSDTPSAYIVMKNGQKKPVQITKLAEYVTKLTGASTKNALGIKEAVVEYPSLFCRNGVDLIDTPGMNDEETMNQVTISRLEGIDLAIVAVDASMPFSMTERAFTAQLLESQQVCQIIVVVTKIDMIRERERQKLMDYMVGRIKGEVKAYLEKSHAPDSGVMRKYHDIFDKPYVFAVSAADALDALSCNNMELFEKSGFLSLNNELPKIILRSQNNSIILNTERVLGNILGQYWGWILQNQEQGRLAGQQLGKIKEPFAQIVYESVSKAFSQTETELPSSLLDMEKEFTVIRKGFTQALGGMRALTLEELRRVFAPTVSRLFQELNARYHRAEEDYLRQYGEKVMKPLGRGLGQKLETLLKPFPQLLSAMQPELSGFLGHFALAGAEHVAAESFYWVRSPIPDAGAIGVDWNVMAYVDPVIRESLADYRKRRWLQMKYLFRQSQKMLEGYAKEFIEGFYRSVAQYSEQGSMGKDGQMVLGRLRQLEGEMEGLRRKFLAEISDEGR